MHAVVARVRDKDIPRAIYSDALRELPHPDVMGPRDKYYNLLTRAGSASAVEPGNVRHLSDEEFPSVRQLSAILEIDKPVKLEVTISDDLARWGRVDRVHEVLLRLRIEYVTEMARLSFKLNGKELPPTLMRTITEVYRMVSPRSRGNTGYWYIFKLDPDHWPVEGKNSLEVTLNELDPEQSVERHCKTCQPMRPHVRDVELETKYLKG